MSHRAIRYGVVHEESQDKGPYKLAKVMADGKTMDVELIDIAGVEGSPLKDSRVLILTPDGDDGKAFGIAFGPAVKDRTDQQKPGEVTYKNHKTGSTVVMKDNGDIIVTTKPGSNITLDSGSGGKLTIKGDITHTGNLQTSGNIKAGGTMTDVEGDV